MQLRKISILIHSYQDRLSNYLPSVRLGVLLIVVPAFFIVTVYFFSIIREIALDKYDHEVSDYEHRLAALKQDLPAHALVNWVSDQNTDNDFVIASYVLIPARLVEGSNPGHDYLIAHFLDKDDAIAFRGYFLLKDYGNGIRLFKRSR